MKEKFKNLRIIYGITAIWILAMIATLVIGITGYSNMEKMNSSITELAKNNLVSVSIMGEVNGTFNGMRNSVTKVIDRAYDSTMIDNVMKADGQIKELINQFNATNVDGTEKKLIGNLTSGYNAYISLFPEVKAKRMVNEVISKDIMTNYGVKGNIVSESIKNIVEYENKSANNAYDNCKKVYNNYKVLFIVIFTSVLLLLSLISLVLILFIKASIKNFSEQLHIISSGDFTLKIDVSGTNEFGIMRRALAATVEGISRILRDIETSANNINEQSVALSAISEEMSASASEVSSAIHDVAVGSTTQAHELVETSNTLSDFGNAVDRIVVIVGDVNSTANSINDMANQSNDQLSELVASASNMGRSFQTVTERITELGSSVNQINEITLLINNIADQTNLLALNAAIEAARAGEAGKGFAVVADEIRKLAEQSKNSSGEINNLLNVISGETEKVISTTDNVNEDLSKQISVIDNSIASFKNIVGAVEKILPQINDVNNEMNKLTEDKDNIIVKVENTVAVAEENSAASEEISATSEQMSASSREVSKASEVLSTKADKMIEAVKQFKL